MTLQSLEHITLQNQAFIPDTILREEMVLISGQSPFLMHGPADRTYLGKSMKVRKRTGVLGAAYCYWTQHKPVQHTPLGSFFVPSDLSEKVTIWHDLLYYRGANVSFADILMNCHILCEFIKKLVLERWSGFPTSDLCVFVSKHPPKPVRTR